MVGQSNYNLIPGQSKLMPGRVRVWLCHCSLETRLNKFLFQYRIMPQTTTGLSPVEMLFGCRLQSHLDLLMLSVKTRVQAHQQQQKINHDGKHRLCEFNIGDFVYVKNFTKRFRDCSEIVLSLWSRHKTVGNREMAKRASPNVEQGDRRPGQNASQNVETRSKLNDQPQEIVPALSDSLRSKAAYTAGSVGNQTLDVLLDSGASCSVICKEHIPSKDVE